MVEKVVRHRTGVTNKMTKSSGVDSSWSWVVMIAAFMAHALTHGFIYSFGLYFIAIQDTYVGSKSMIAWIPSIITGCLYLIGPLTSRLVHRCGCQRVGSFGTGLAFLGLFLSLFAPNIYVLYITMGILNGAGIGLIFLPSVLSVTIYFNKYRGVAAGFAFSGCGIGGFAFSPLVEYMLQEYGLKGSLLIYSGLVLNSLPCCLMYRTLALNHEDRSEPDIEYDSRKLVKSQEQRGSQTSENKNYLPIKHKSQEEEQTVFLLNPSKDIELKDEYEIKKPNSESEVNEEKRYGRIYESEIEQMSQELVTEISADNKKDLTYSKEDSTWTRYGLLLKNRSTVLFFVSQFLFFVGSYIPFIFLPDKAKLHDIEEKDSAWIISTIGISSTIGRIILGYLADRPYVNRKVLFKIVLISSGISTAICPWLDSFWSLVVYAALYGIFMGTTVSLTSVVLLDIVGVSGLTDAIGLNYLLSGLGALMGPPFAGLLYDLTNTYSATFYFSGGTIAIAGLMIICL